MTAFLYRDVFGGQNPSLPCGHAEARNPRSVTAPYCRKLRLQPAGALFYVAFLLVPVFAFLLNRTRFGLEVKAVGENLLPPMPPA